MRAPAIIRPTRDTPMLPITLAGALACALGGYFLGATVFRPSTGAEVEGEAPAAPEVADAGAAPAAVTDAGTIAAQRPATPVGPSVPVSVRAGAFMGCGDGEEINLGPEACDVPAPIEAALRMRLGVILGQCPSAAAAARDPQHALSLGLRVDRVRRRVSVLLGRSSTVPDKVSFVPCARDALGPLEDVWRVQAAHPRYLWYFTARFGPLPPGFNTDAAVAAPPAPVPAAPAPAEPAPAPAPAPEPAPAPAPATPEPAPTNLPTAAEILRMRVIGRATTVWSATIVRDAPRTGAIVARLPQGTAVELVDRRGGWFAIRWDRDHAGWAFREPLGQ